MLNIYDGMLKIINPKLYNSPYMVNVNDVKKVLDGYTFKSKVLFSINLFGLSIEEMSYSIKKTYNNAAAVYIPYDNTIYIKNLLEKDKVVNHELFHVSSNNFMKKKAGITLNDGIECLDEGITEYLKLKSKNELSSDYGYQLEVFVVEFLVFIYKEKILEPYFSGNGKKFYRQFGENNYTIKKINYLLNEISQKSSYQVHRLNYLLALELFPNSVSKDCLDDLELNVKTKYVVKSFFDSNKEVSYKLKEYKKDKNITAYNYKYQDINNIYYSNWEEEYKNKVCNILEEIIVRLIEIAFLNNITKNEIVDFLEKSYNNKSDRFKDVYSKIFNEVLYKKNDYRKGR